MPEKPVRPSYETALSNVRNRLDTLAAELEKHQSQLNEIPADSETWPFHFRIYQDKKPLAHVRLIWKKGPRVPLEWEYLPRTNHQGWGLLGPQSQDAPDPGPLRLEVLQGAKWLVVTDILLPAGAEKAHFQGEEGILLELMRKRDPIPGASSERDRPSIYRLGIAGKGDQIRTLVPMIESRTCLRVEKVFLKGKIPSGGLSLRKRVKIIPLKNSLLPELENLQLLLDLTGSPRLRKLYNDQIQGKARTKTIILPQGELLYKYLDDLLL